MPFILSDGNKVNSYGFRVNTAGIDLSRFLTNPVMYADHWGDSSSVLGKWNDVHVEGSNLVADPEFDAQDEMAMKIKGKVDRGYVKGASVGLIYHPDDLVKQADGNYELMKSELMEASITPIPSNANALKLYISNADGVSLMNEKQIKLSIQNLENKNHKKENSEMKKIILSQTALIALNLLDANTSDGVEAEQVNAKITALKVDYDKSAAELTATKTALQTLQTQAQEQKKLAAEKLINDAIAAGKLNATQKDSWLNLALTDEALAKATLDGIPAKKSLSSVVNNPPTPPATMTMDDFAKMSDEQQLKFKRENPDAYNALLQTLPA